MARAVLEHGAGRDGTTDVANLTLDDLPSAPDTRGSRRTTAREARRRRRARRVRTLVVLLVCVAVLAGSGWAAEGQLEAVYHRLTAPQDYTGPGSGSVRVDIPAGASGRAIGTVLAGAGVVKTAGAFTDAAAKDRRSTAIQPGTYQLRRHMSAASAITLLLAPAAKLSIKVTIPEGFTAAKTLQRLAQETGRPVADFQAAAKDPSLGLPPEAGGDVEGYLFPATYTFDPKTSPAAMLAAMVAKAQAVMTSVGLPADPSARRSDLILASLVQAEAGSDADMGKIARVLDNRLAAGQALQLDTTVNYATGKTGLTTTTADRADTSPYNTYVHTGLPPGPIDAPGQAALQAVLNPTPGPWLFFVVVDPSTGQTLFATTLAEHEQNVAKFQAWLKAHPQQG